MSRRNRKAINPFHHPDPYVMDYGTLLDAMRDCRKHVSRLRGLCGLRNPLTREAEALIAQIDAVAAVTRVPGAKRYVNHVRPRHSTPMERLADDEYSPWTDADIAAFRKTWPLGTRERLAMELLFNTGFKRGDIVRLGRQHIRRGFISLVM